MQIPLSNIVSLIIIGGLSVLAVLHVLMYFKARRRPAHWFGFVADISVIMLMAFAGSHSVWGDWALNLMGERVSRGVSFFFLSSLFGCLGYIHAMMAKLRRINNWYIFAPPVVFILLVLMFFIVDPAYFALIRHTFYFTNFLLIGYVICQLLMSVLRGDRNAIFFLITFSLITVFFIFAVCFDFASHPESFLDYLALFIIMVVVDINMIVSSGFSVSKSRTEQWSAPLTKQIEDLQTSNQTKDRFLSIIAHDLKNPIASIKMLSDIYLEEAQAEKSSHKMDLAESLSMSIDNLYKLLENLLTWTRTQNDTIKCMPQMLDVNTIVEHLKYSVEPICCSKNIEMKVSVKGEPTIYADSNMIQTVLRNLVTNAVKYSYPDNFIDVVFDSDDFTYIIKVIDNGIGIPKDILARLFKLDQITSTSGTQMETGTGLGLILCHEFVQKHHGEIVVSSEQGLGTTFSVVLPKG